MTVSNKIFRALEKIGFEHDSPEDTNTIYKGIVSGGTWTNVSLYFSYHPDEAGRLDFGFLVQQSVDKALRGNLKVELHNVAGVQKCTDAEEVEDDDDNVVFWIYCSITVVNDATVDWIKSIMEELERRALFLINK